MTPLNFPGRLSGQSDFSIEPPYPHAGHSFLNEAPNGPKPLRVVLRAMGTGPHPESAADAWQRIEAFFAEHIGPGPE